MKIRCVRMREAHKVTSGTNSCSILWNIEAEHLVTASSSDNSIAVHDPLLPSTPPSLIGSHKDGVTALALNPNSTCIASGSNDRSVKLYKFPGGEFQCNITRFTLPIRALTFNRSGSILAAGGDDEGIKLINTVDGSIARVLKGHRGSVGSLAFDPNSEYLASADSLGTVIFWELLSGKSIHILKNIAPDFGLGVSATNIISWSPNGYILAVPGTNNDVVLHDRDTAEKLFTLSGDHLMSVCFLCWSPNGKYLATSGLDKQVFIWNVKKKQEIDRHRFDDQISCMSWRPNGNSLAVIDVMGKYGVWDSPVPSSLKSPSEDAPNLPVRNSNGFFDDNDDIPSSSGSLGDAGVDIPSESESPNGGKSLPISKSRKSALVITDEKHSSGREMGTKRQAAFQPGATPMESGKPHFLCYNMLGSIITNEHDGYHHIEIDFHDTGKGPRLPSMTDYFGFTMATFNENGSVFANSCSGDKGTSTLMYRPFCSWATNSEWSMRFEEVKVVALGRGWVAAITSHNFVRIFTDGGLQSNVISIDGPVVTASGFNDELAIVTHACSSSYLNDQMLQIVVFNVSQCTQPLKGFLPLTPGSCLSWFGFSEEGQLSSYDSKGVLRVYSEQFGGSWIPIFRADKLEKPEDNYWVVGLNESKMYCILCKNTELFPQVLPKPVLSLVDFSLPLASSDLGAESLENEFVLSNISLSKIQRNIEKLSAAGEDISSLDDKAFNIEVTMDKCILRLIASCCNANKLVRAVELVKLLSHVNSVRGAIKLVTALKLPYLADRFTDVLENRLVDETRREENNPKEITLKQSATLVHSSSTHTGGGNFGEDVKTTPQKIDRSSETEPAAHTPSTQLSPHVLLKKRKLKEKCEEIGGIVKGVVRDSGSDGDKKKEDVSRRPMNPFAKSTSSQEKKASLLDSVKRMKEGVVNTKQRP